MKKLLSILGATSLVVSAPLSVVACKKKVNPNIGDEFDYSQLINDFVQEVTVIIETQIQAAFYDYRWMSDEQISLYDLSIQEIIENREDFNNPQSDFYKKIEKLIIQVIPIQKINDEIAVLIAENINYNPILIDKRSPLKDGIVIDSFKLEIKNEKNISLTTEFLSSVWFKNKQGENDFNNVKSKTTITVFEEEELVDWAKKLEENYLEMINVISANDFVFRSDKGNLENTAQAIPDNSQIINDIKSKISSMEFGTKYISDRLKLNVNQDCIIDASRFSNGSFGDHQQSPSRNYEILMKAYKGSEKDEQKILKEIKKKGSLPIENFFIDPVIDKYYLEMILATNLNPNEISENINQYNLTSNYLKNKILSKIVKSQNSKFEINLKNDNNTIALFGTEVSGVEFELEGENYQLIDQTIVLKQITTKKNTFELFSDFVEDAYHWEKEFVSMNSDPDDATFNLIMPKSWNKLEIIGKQLSYPEYCDELLQANEKANLWLENFDLTPKITKRVVETSDSKWVEPPFMYINKEGYLFIYDKPISGQGLETNILRVFFYSSGKKTSKTNYNWGYHIHKTSSRSPEQTENLDEFFTNRISLMKFKNF
ncbi:lipoprotein [Spiroplasma alleghenense]|uniref:Lipoprotein n=1 Tax=Spiroplasma alleghenense TaxID=216931 RepID=A0A345Z576_9MOLU|nr:lipoprotein [Spiroplasma alleghenense]AXK51755.1 hypothetical protein SALLE_v1c10850 [Spiroplasma alleghenense]